METPFVVLLIEDELQVRKLISEVLHQAGYQVIAASSGPDAIRAFNRSKKNIDLVIADVDLSGAMSGLEIAERLEAMRPDLRILLMSGSVRYSIAFEDNLHFIRKPFAPAQFLSKVKEVLSHKAGLHFRRDCNWISHLLANRYPRVHIECIEEQGNQYVIRLKLRPELPGNEVRFSVKEYLDGEWEEKIAAAVDHLHSL